MLELSTSTISWEPISSWQRGGCCVEVDIVSLALALEIGFTRRGMPGSSRWQTSFVRRRWRFSDSVHTYFLCLRPCLHLRNSSVLDPTSAFIPTSPIPHLPCSTLHPPSSIRVQLQPSPGDTAVAHSFSAPIFPFPRIAIDTSGAVVKGGLVISSTRDGYNTFADGDRVHIEQRPGCDPVLYRTRRGCSERQLLVTLPISTLLGGDRDNHVSPYVSRTPLLLSFHTTLLIIVAS